MQNKTPPYMEFIPYKKNIAINLFSYFSNQPWSMLLHSGESNHQDSRFDIFVSYPSITLISKNGITKINDQGKCSFSYIDPFILVKQKLLESNITCIPNSEIPFMGGAVGVFGYDLFRYIENINSVKKTGLEVPDMAIGIYRWAIIIDNHLCTVKLVSYDNPKKILKKIINIQSISYSPFCIISSWRRNMYRSDYKKKFFKIKKYLLNGDCYQICLSQQFKANFLGNTWTAFQKLLDFNKSPFSAFIRLDHQTIISMSPERFLHVRNRNICTKPIKGTISRILNNLQLDRFQIEKLSKSKKNQSENIMIVDLLRNDISKVSEIGSVYVSAECVIETFSTVHHMVSTINAVLLKNYSSIDLLRACFPGGSITGVPKIQAMKIIEKLEPNRRNIWYGSIGYISFCGSMDMNIAIRTLIAENGTIYHSSGSAITIDSNEEEEYQEILDKADSILKVLCFE